jgi:hypothetical protein
MLEHKSHEFPCYFSVGSVTFTVACVQLAETLRFGIGCMEDDHIPHFASLKRHDQKLDDGYKIHFRKPEQMECLS